MTLGVSDGDRLYAVRYSSIGQSRTLFRSADAQTLRALHPTTSWCSEIGDEDRAVVSEPLGDLPGVVGGDPRGDGPDRPGRARRAARVPAARGERIA